MFRLKGRTWSRFELRYGCESESSAKNKTDDPIATAPMSSNERLRHRERQRNVPNLYLSQGVSYAGARPTGEEHLKLQTPLNREASSFCEDETDS